MTFDHRPKPAHCDICPLSGVRKVGSKGPWDAPIVIIGEGPGKVELIKGIPFVGPSGQLLEKSWPDHIDVPLDGVFVINAMQCSIFGQAKKEDTEAKMLAATKACGSRVWDLLALAPRKLVLGVGKWANVVLSHNDDCKITQIRGDFYEAKDPDPARGITYRVMPTIHPAALLRGFGNITHFRGDLIRGLEWATDTPGAGFTPPYYKELPTAESVLSVIDYIKRMQEWSESPLLLHADTETTGFRYHADNILCVGIWIDASVDDSNTAWIIDWDRVRIQAKEMGVPESETPLYAAVKQLLELPRELFLYDWQNGKFDIKWWRFRGIEARVDEDTFLLDYTLNEQPGSHDLDEIAKNRIGAPNHKHIIKQWVNKPSDTYAKIPKPELWKYLAWDLKKTGAVHPLLREEVNEDENNHKLYVKTLLPASEMIARVEMRGICVDTFTRDIPYKDFDGEEKIHHGTFVTLNQLQYSAEMQLVQQQISELAGYWVNPNSPQQVKELLFGRLDLKLKGRTPKDTTKETLDKLPPHPVVKAIRKYRRLSKILGTYINTVPKHMAADGRIHSTYNLGGTRTGRLASSEPNVQNIPREGRVRRMYCAPPGRELSEGDYNTAELRMLAALSGDVFLTGVFLDDTRNLHDEVSVAMYGENFTADERIRAKAINFGIPYGREAFSIAAEFDIVTAEAQRLIDAWFKRAPEATAFLAKCRQAPSLGQTLISIFGRKCRPGVVSFERLAAMENEFRNFFMQSTINDFGLHAAMELDYRLEKLDSWIVNLVHDSLLVENPPAARKEVVGLMKYYMENVPKRWIRTPIEFSVDFKHGQYWGLLEKAK